ncbi:hypothetical protein BB559_002187 [Furculomyces boomerangus]|uniref:Endonuclease/exonuclease/phosphatase domain-containing protein n=1 Tax=Furculomyces boomerangus TaxID=61424 RepID=A0A2T9YX93_9FUNG|nr:hypothetical protein BB559_002187 [Furculomyces boomerangus]
MIPPNISDYNPGNIVTLDRRPQKLDQTYSTNQSETQSNNFQIKTCCWNIERGYKIDLIIEQLKQLDVDIICLQELDIFNERSGNTNQFEMLCTSLQMFGFYASEFKEIKSNIRTKDLQGGGFHGNAILSKYDMKCFLVEHEHQPYNWAKDGHTLGQPRIGGLVSLNKRIDGRLGQLTDLAYLSNKIRKEYPFQLLYGDMNTFAHSIARLSPKYCTDKYRFLSLFVLEPEFWYKNILNPKKYVPHINCSGWVDPFDPTTDYTITNHWGLMKAKTDWTFVLNMDITCHHMLNDDFELSDHKGLIVNIELPVSFKKDPEIEKSEFKSKEIIERNIGKINTHISMRIGFTFGVFMGIGLISSFLIKRFWK